MKLFQSLDRSEILRNYLDRFIKVSDLEPGDFFCSLLMSRGTVLEKPAMTSDSDGNLLYRFYYLDASGKIRLWLNAVNLVEKIH